MKWLKSISVMMLVLMSFQGASAQKSKSSKTGTIQKMIEQRSFVFEARTVIPMSGRTRQISGEGYDVMVSKDTVNSYLPYFGRAYSAPIDPSRGGIQFISQKFTYDVKTAKKGGWDITIKPQDVQDVQQFQLSVSEDGYASLQVTSTNRQPISFNGIVTAKRPRKK